MLRFTFEDLKVGDWFILEEDKPIHFIFVKTLPFEKMGHQFNAVRMSNGNARVFSGPTKVIKVH